jgi:DnaJ-domain-containing protein 1
LDQFFDRLGDILKNATKGDSGEDIFGRKSAKTGDPDLDEAFEELDEFLKTGKDKPRPEGQSQRQTNFGHAQSHQSFSPPQEIIDAYKELQLAYGNKLPEVRAQYKKLLKQYHPDKNADNPEKLRVATEITQKINGAYQKIETWLEKGHL